MPLANNDKESDVKAGHRILVVDDEVVILEFVNEVLSQMGHHVDTADNAITALSMIQQNLYGLVFLDIRLPGMSGIELYERIKVKAPYLTKRIVFITGDFLASETKDFLFRNKVLYVAKPLDWDKLVQAVNDTI